jgi:hypothetical protein
VGFPLGLYLWNGLGPNFGLRAAAGKVDHRAAYFSCGLPLLTAQPARMHTASKNPARISRRFTVLRKDGSDIIVPA